MADTDSKGSNARIIVEFRANHDLFNDELAGQLAALRPDVVFTRWPGASTLMWPMTGT